MIAYQSIMENCNQAPGAIIMHTFCYFYYTNSSATTRATFKYDAYLRGIFLYGPKKIIMVYHQHCINLLLINISNHVLHCYNYCVPVLVSLLMLFVFYLASLKEYSLQYIIYNNINNMPLCDLLIDKKCRIECRSSDL